MQALIEASRHQAGTEDDAPDPAATEPPAEGDEGAEGGAEAPEGDAGGPDEDPAAPGAASEAPEGDATPDAEQGETEPAAKAPFEPFGAVTVAAPLTLVDDEGKPVKVLLNPGTSVYVLAAEATRVKVRCELCLPQVVGWVQVASVKPR